MLSRGIGAKAGGASTETEDAEIGELPDGWKAVSVKDVVQRTHQVDPTRNPDVKFNYVDVSSVSSERLTITDSTEFEGEELAQSGEKSHKNRRRSLCNGATLSEADRQGSTRT